MRAETKADGKKIERIKKRLSAMTLASDTKNLDVLADSVSSLAKQAKAVANAAQKFAVGKEKK